jgi:hypothetical protein
MSTDSRPRNRKVLIAVMCGVFGFGLVSFWPVLKFIGTVRQHQRQVRERIAEFNRYSPQRWAEIAKVCRTYWEETRVAQSSDSTRPPLPQPLSVLNPVYHSVEKDEFFLSWTGGFDDDILYLKFSFTGGKATLWLICSENDPRDTMVWSDSDSPP